MKNYQALAAYVKSMDISDFCRNTIDQIMDSAPSGSGFDNGTQFIAEKSGSTKLVFTTAFHHMNENGYYDGWTHHVVTVKADLAIGFDIHITGRNKNDIKEYISEEFTTWLERDFEPRG